MSKRKVTKRNAQPLYKTVKAPVEPVIGNEELAAELPISSNALAGGIPKWEDPLFDLSPTAYVEMRRCLAIKKGHRKLAIRTTKLNWTMVGAESRKPTVDTSSLTPAQSQLVPDTLQLEADPALVAAITPDSMGTEAPAPGVGQTQTQTRSEALAEIFGQIEGWSDFIDHCTGSLYEGTRPYQIKTTKPDDPRNRSQGKWTIPNLFMGGRHRYNAGGDIEWDGGSQLIQVEKTTGNATRKTRMLPLDQFAIHRPGPGSNPEGDLDLGVGLYNAVVKPWGRGIISGDLWVRLFSVPAILAGTKVDKARPDRITDMLNRQAAQVSAAVNNQGSVTALTNQELVQLLQADPGGLTGIVAWQQYLESLVDDVLTLAALTSSAGVAQASRTGNTAEQKDNEDEAAFANGVLIAETFNRHILPWIIEKNPGLPPLAEGEPEVYLWPNDPNEGDEQDIGVETEGVKGPGALDLSPVDKLADVEATAAMFADMQARSMTARGRQAQVALAAFSPTPPVH